MAKAYAVLLHYVRVDCGVIRNISRVSFAVFVSGLLNAINAELFTVRRPMLRATETFFIFIKHNLRDVMGAQYVFCHATTRYKLNDTTYINRCYSPGRSSGSGSRRQEITRI